MALRDAAAFAGGRCDECGDDRFTQSRSGERSQQGQSLDAGEFDDHSKRAGPCGESDADSDAFQQHEQHGDDGRGGGTSDSHGQWNERQIGDGFVGIEWLKWLQRIVFKQRSDRSLSNLIAEFFGQSVDDSFESSAKRRVPVQG